MKILWLGLTLVLIAAFALSSCQSVATTSAKLRNEEGNYEIAISLARKALEQNPNDAEAYFQLGVSYSNLDSVDLAYRYFQKSAEINPKKKKMANNNIRHNYSKHYNLGLKAFNHDDYAAAAREFEKATKADPRESISFYNLGVAYARLAKQDSTYYEKALSAFNTVLAKATPDQKHYIDAIKLHGKILADLGRVEEAIEQFNRLVEEDPANYIIIEKLGYDRMKQKDWKGAAVFLDLAARARAKIGAEDFNLYYNLGAINYNMRKEDPSRVEEAIKFYQKALDMQPEEPQTTFNIMVSFMFLKKWDQAAAWGEKYVSVKPEDEKGWQILAISYGEMGEKEKARQASIRYEELMKMKGKAE